MGMHIIVNYYLIAVMLLTNFGCVDKLPQKTIL